MIDIRHFHAQSKWKAFDENVCMRTLLIRKNSFIFTIDFEKPLYNHNS